MLFRTFAPKTKTEEGKGNAFNPKLHVTTNQDHEFQKGFIKVQPCNDQEKERNEQLCMVRFRYTNQG